MEERDSLIQTYFHLGLQQWEMLAVLSRVHGITISERHLKRILKNCNLYRRLNYSDVGSVVEFIQRELQFHGQLQGYRWMHLRCIQNGFTVKRENVRLILKALDPAGVEMRSRRRLRRRTYFNKGPNYLWHMDGYDKLKPYGICISGCIDGFSRYIVWLQASFTNSDPKVIAGYYLNTVKDCGGCPNKVRADMGTENGHVASFQTFLRETDSTPDRVSFLYGRSPCNQRIEAWWFILRKENAQFWMNLFEEMKDQDLFNGTLIDKGLLQFCFLPIIQKDLNRVAQEWNTHRIRNSRNSISPSGRPLMLYHSPQIYGTQDYLSMVDSDKISICEEECRFPNLPCDEDIYDLATVIMREKNIQASEDPFEMVEIYNKLRTEIYAGL